MDALQRLFEGDAASRTEIHLETEDSRPSQGKRPRPHHCHKWKEKTPKRAPMPVEGHLQNSDPFITCSNGDKRHRRHRQERGTAWPEPAVDEVIPPL